MYKNKVFVDCVAKVEETRDKGLATARYFSSEEDSLVNCQFLCVTDLEACAAADYNNGTCVLFNKVQCSSGKLIENVGNVHSVLKKCDA